MWASPLDKSCSTGIPQSKQQSSSKLKEDVYSLGTQSASHGQWYGDKVMSGQTPIYATADCLSKVASAVKAELLQEGSRAGMNHSRTRHRMACSNMAEKKIIINKRKPLDRSFQL